MLFAVHNESKTSQIFKKSDFWRFNFVLFWLFFRLWISKDKLKPMLEFQTSLFLLQVRFTLCWRGAIAKIAISNDFFIELILHMCLLDVLDWQSFNRISTIQSLSSKESKKSARRKKSQDQPFYKKEIGWFFIHLYLFFSKIKPGYLFWFSLGKPRAHLYFWEICLENGNQIIA